MKMTSAQAAKELRKLNDQHEALLAMENKVRWFTAAIQEDIESVRPAYDYTARREVRFHPVPFFEIGGVR